MYIVLYYTDKCNKWWQCHKGYSVLKYVHYMWSHKVYLKVDLNNVKCILLAQEKTEKNIKKHKWHAKRADTIESY